MTNKSGIKIILDLVQLLKDKEEKIAKLLLYISKLKDPLSAQFSRPPNQFLRFGGGSKRNDSNADVPTPKKDTKDKTAETSLEEPLILK
jgi:hypothetical protein